MTLMSDKKTPDGRKMVAIPITIELVAYTEEHSFLEQMTIVGGDLEILKNMHKETFNQLLEVDDRLAKLQKGWQTILVERVK